MRFPGLSTPAPALVAIFAARVAAVGMTQAVRDFGVSRETYARIQAGLPVRAGSLALAEKHAASLGVEPPQAPPSHPPAPCAAA